MPVIVNDQKGIDGTSASRTDGFIRSEKPQGSGLSQLPASELLALYPVLTCRLRETSQRKSRVDNEICFILANWTNNFRASNPARGDTSK